MPNRQTAVSDDTSTLPKPFVFVLMPFAAEFTDVYERGIKGAAAEIGAYAERMDDQMFSEGMMDRLYNQISKADVVVADMTGRNANVFYIPIHVTNEGPEASRKIDYVYWFAEREGVLVPADPATGKSFKPWTPRSADVADGLLHQWRLGTSVDALPSGATTQLEPWFTVNSPLETGSVHTRHRIRLHSSSLVHDFSFTIHLSWGEM